MPGDDSKLKQAVLVGAGRMGTAMARGWLRSLAGAGLSRLFVVEPAPDDEVSGWGKAAKIALNSAAVPVDVVVLAVKPQAFANSTAMVKGWIGAHTMVVSIMAGITIAHISKALGVTRVARAMPNTPGAIGRGVTGYALSAQCGAPEKRAAERLLAPLGEVVGPLDEACINAVTAVSGSGPAYVFLLAEALEAAARSAGLDNQTAAKLARQTVIGAGALLAEGGDPAALRHAVTSPGGTTAAALEVLMAPGAAPDLVRQAVEAAIRRGEELARASESKT